MCKEHITQNYHYPYSGNIINYTELFLCMKYNILSNALYFSVPLKLGIVTFPDYSCLVENIPMIEAIDLYDDIANDPGTLIDGVSLQIIFLVVW